MRVYVESSVLLRIVLGERDRLREWSRITEAMTSDITRVECLRTLDRLRLIGLLRFTLLGVTVRNSRRRACSSSPFGGAGGDWCVAPGASAS